MTTRILVVDDDPDLASTLRRGLSYEGYSVETASTGEEALAKTREREPDLAILDIMLPGMDGIELCKRLRQASNIPILMLSAKGMVTDRVVGLDSGADDYVVKPFSFDELLARVRALLRRGQDDEAETLRFGDLSLNTYTREVMRGSQSIPLTAQEFGLLELFMRHPHQVLEKNVIYDHIWGYDYDGQSNVLDVYVSYLRAKLESDNAPRVIHTVRGVGYVLKES
jgi:two-component system response regulator MprA